MTDGINHKLWATAGAILIVFVWSGWFIISRNGVRTNLTPEDITFIRFSTGALCALPFALRYNWKKLTLWKATIVALGCGFPYTMFTFYGLKSVKAANAGVIVNGLLPVFGAILALLVLGQKSSKKNILAIVIILAANLLMISGTENLMQDWMGWLMLMSASLVFSSYMFLGKRWGYTAMDVLAFLPLINTILFIPIWLMSDSGLAQAELSEIVTQALYQGVLVSVIALILTFYAITHMGAMNLSIYFSFVPFITSIMAWLILGESLTNIEIGAIVMCSMGLFIYVKK